MGVYIKLFETQNDFKDEYYGEGYEEPWLSLTLENEDVRYNKTEREKYLTFEVLSSGYICLRNASGPQNLVIEYKLNHGDWTSVTVGSTEQRIQCSSGDTIMFRGDNPTYGTSNGGLKFSGTTSFNVSGNIMSLIDSTGFSTADTLNSPYTFSGLFNGCSNLRDASKLVLPATALTQNCYYSMFNGCTSLTTAPELPATTLANYCYQYMFYGCTSLTTAPELSATTLTNYCYASMLRDCIALTTAPELPATTLAQNCYSYMFSGCQSLTTAPELPATTLISNCYYEMFRNCRSLNYIKCLATDISASNCATRWVSDVASTGTFVKASSMTGWDTGANGIPSNWTVQDA